MEADTGGQFVPGSATSSRPPHEPRSFSGASDDAVPADTAKDVRGLVRMPSGFDPNAPAAATNEVLPPGRPASFDDRFGNWTSYSGVGAPLDPNQPVAPSPQAGRPLGLVSGEPMPDYPFPMPIFDAAGRPSRPGHDDWALWRLRRAEWDKAQ